MEPSTQRTGQVVAGFLPLLSAVFLFAFVQQGQADVGPAISNQPQTQKQTAPVTRAVPARQVDEQLLRKEPRGASGAWFEDVRDKLTYETFEIHPRGRGEYILDDNILLESRDEKLDSIFREVPGVGLVFPIYDSYVKADYEAEFEQFIKFPKENTINQYFTSEVALNFTDVYLEAKESVTHTSSRSGTTFTERIPRFENDLETLIGYRFNEFTLEAGYGTFYRSFDTSREKPLNYGTHEWTGKLFMDVTEKTKVFVEYDFTSYDYFKDETRDGKGHKFYGGIEGALFPKTKLYSKFGYERFDVDQGKDANNFVSEVGVLYTPLARTSIDIGWTRQTTQSTFSNTDFFTEDKLFTRLRQRFTTRVSGEVNVTYTNQDYETITNTGAGAFIGERDDDLFTTDVKLAYMFTDWLSADIKYYYGRRDSNASLFDYTNNQMTVGLSAKV